jgi:hypothetical protein
VMNPRPALTAALMGFVAGTLVVMSSLHLSGTLTGTSEPFDPSHAGIAEALIAAVLAVGAAVLLREPPRAETAAIASTGFAIVGFIVGLNFTIRGGGATDIAYHAVVLPLLLLILATLLRARRATGSATNTSTALRE